MSESPRELLAGGPNHKNYKDYKEAVVEGKTTSEMAEAHAKEFPIKTVQVEVLVLSKITKHCAERFPTLATGFIVGMEVKGVLQMTNSYNYITPDPPASDSHHDTNAASSLAAAAPRSKANVSLQNDMIKLVRDVNIDANFVGWYTSANMGNFITSALVENQYFFQKELNERVVCLVHDVSRSSQGASSLRAFRLSPSFMGAYKDGKFTTEQLQKSNVTYKDIFVELPVQVHASHLIAQWLSQFPKTPSQEKLKMPTSLAGLEKAAAKMQDPLCPNFEALDLSVDPYLEKTADNLLESIETHYTELNNHQYHQRQVAREQAKITAWQQKRRAENAVRAAAKQTPLPEDEWTRLFKLPQEPSRLDTLVNSKQIEQYARQIDGYTASVTAKMFAVKNNLLPGSEQQDKEPQQ